ncbi:hypothetical protein [Bailinhaonella thermotolerans]|uniref:hypothetical protein n=1 Tax=Bailinhaonella thermotolerans TaxID=1070861 RepID=UPI0011C3D018|nr:hypothetical protein [Bailinhaonella thermotolerans]
MHRFKQAIAAGLGAGALVLGGGGAAYASAGQEIEVTLNPARTVTGPGKTVEIVAQCPREVGKPLRGIATSPAFGTVTLQPITEGQAGVRGVAKLETSLEAKTYEVKVRCESNHTGQANLEIVGPLPTKGPKAGGGGTALGAAGEDDGMSFGPLGIGALIVVAGGVGVAFARRRAANG